MTRGMALLAGVLACVLASPGARAQQYPAPELLSVLFTGWTTGGRPVSPAAGTMGYNTSLNQLEVWNGSAWVAITATGVFGTMANQNANAVAITGGTVALAAVSSTSAAAVLNIKNGPGGTNLLTMGGANADLEPQTNIKLPAGTLTWGSGPLVNNTALIIQNDNFAGTVATGTAAFGAFLQQVDNSSNTGVLSPAASVGFLEHLTLGGTSVVGGRVAGLFTLDITTATANADGKDYTGLGSKCNLMVTDPPSPATRYSGCTGSNPVGHVGAAVTNADHVVGEEIDTWAEIGAVVDHRLGLQIVDTQGSTFGQQATGDDMALSINNQYAPTSSLGFKTGISFGRNKGQFPIATTGTLIYGTANLGGAWTVANGIDWSLGTVTNNWMNMGGLFLVSATGGVTAAGYKAGAAVGVSCSGATTGSFASVNGIVTHC